MTRIQPHPEGLVHVFYAALVQSPVAYQDWYTQVSYAVLVHGGELLHRNSVMVPTYAPVCYAVYFCVSTTFCKFLVFPGGNFFP